MESELDDDSQENAKGESGLKLEYCDYDRNYETIAVSSPQTLSSTGAVKGKYYKQTYRSAWEQMPDFKGWLTGVQGEPTRAYCLYCQKTLHAHRLSLLKHTCTIRHQKAAQLHNSRKGKKTEMELQMHFVNDNVSLQDDVDADEDGAMGDQTTIEIEEQENDIDPENEEAEEDEDDGTLDNVPIHYIQKNIRTSTVMTTKPPITTHALDLAHGTAVAGLQVSLYKLIDGRWTYINEGVTNGDGRFANFMDREDFTTGRYKLHFDVDRYFELRKQESLYPFIEVVLDCRSATDHYHVPLLLSPYGYTTYRGT